MESSPHSLVILSVVLIRTRPEEVLGQWTAGYLGQVVDKVVANFDPDERQGKFGYTKMVRLQSWSRNVILITMNY